MGFGEDVNLENVIFEVGCEFTKQTVKEIMNDRYRKSKAYLIYNIVVSVLVVLIGIFYLYRSNIILGLFFILGCPFLVWFFTARNKRKVGNDLLDTFLKLHPSGEANYYFTETMFGEVGGKPYDYSQITDVTEGNQIIMIYIGSAVQFYSKDKFTKGRAEELVNFINNKRH